MESYDILCFMSTKWHDFPFALFESSLKITSTWRKRILYSWLISDILNLLKSCSTLCSCVGLNMCWWYCYFQNLLFHVLSNMMCARIELNRFNVIVVFVNWVDDFLFFFCWDWFNFSISMNWFDFQEKKQGIEKDKT